MATPSGRHTLFFKFSLPKFIKATDLLENPLSPDYPEVQKKKEKSKEQKNRK